MTPVEQYARAAEVGWLVPVDVEGFGVLYVTPERAEEYRIGMGAKRVEHHAFLARIETLRRRERRGLVAAFAGALSVIVIAALLTGCGGGVLE